MLAVSTHSYALNLQYFEQHTSRSATGTAKDSSVPVGGRENGIRSTKLVELRLEVQQHSRFEFNDQTMAKDLAQKLAVGLKRDKFNQSGQAGKLPTNPVEAKLMVGEDGYWGVAKTSQRLAQFVLKGGGDNLEMLRAGREGILRGFKEAEKMWGGKLPEISHQTIEKALAAIDDRIQQLGGAIIDRAA